ncbi:MAG TPA: CFI-box-CTERM domain-containing protein [Nitrososphaeraceae archaeon]|nr:CFI-box-CTERM domain-containing protein [Nitrososphaeraceae archaeon]
MVVSTYGHGLGQDQSPPVTIQGKQVTVEGVINPSFLPVPDSPKPTLVIRAHDENNNVTIAGIDYRIVVELRNETLLDQRFRSSDGVVASSLIPDSEVEGWEISGQAKPSDRIEVSQSSPIELRSRILTAGGLYHIAITIEKSSMGISVQADQKFDLYISVGDAYTFDLDTPQGQNQMVVKTYYDEIMNFNYSNKTISFQMPFTWDRAYIAQVPVLHVEVQFPKSLEELQTNSYRGTLDGRDLEAQAVVIDDYSSEQNRIVHFIVSNAMLSRFANIINDNNSNIAAFTLQPSEKPKFPLDLTSLPSEKFLFQLSWGPDIIETGMPITFVMNIQDPKTGDLVRGASFDFVLTQTGNEIHQKHIVMDLGTYSYQYTFSKAGTVTLAANNINGQGESAKIDLSVLQGSGNTTNPQSQPQSNPSQCLIATAAFGSELTPQVQYLRNFRDHYILSAASGSAFMNTFNSVYYSFSPQVAEYERGQPWLQGMVKMALYPLFGILMIAERGYAALGGEAGSVLAGVIASLLIGAVYLWPIGFAASRRVIDCRLLVIIVGAAAAFLVATLVALPAMLPFSTATFVVAVAGASAIAVAKVIRYFFSRRV